MGADHWAANVRRPVLFGDAAAAAAAAGVDAFVEVGPHPVLARYLTAALGRAGRQGAVLPSLRRGEDERAGLLRSLGNLYALGAPVSWAALYPRGRFVSLPTYPWQRERFWVELSHQVPGNGRAAGAAPDPAAKEVEDLLYEPRWERQALQPGATNGHAPTGAWLILADDGGLGEALALALEARGQGCVIVKRGPAFVAGPGRQLTADPGRPEDFAGLLEATAGAGLRGLVHLWALDASERDLAASHVLAYDSVLHAAQALAGRVGPRPPRLVLVSRGTQAAGGAPGRVNVAGAPLWGLGRVLTIEQPQSRGLRVDLDPAAPPAEVQDLAEELLAEGREDQVAFRDEARYVLRLARLPLAPDTRTVSLRADGTYLVTGGLGGLGLEVAGWMVRQGARHLLLLGRRGGGAAPEAVEALRKAGAEVVAPAADVADRDRLAAVLAEAARTMPPLRGVVHAAGVLDDGVLARQTAARYRPVAAPKVGGAWNLHELTAEAPLDFFVCFSSAASLLGSPGQGNYAAANAFLDALAAHRRGQGRPALSINWGSWSEVGMAARTRRSDLSARGDEDITPAEGVAALGLLLGRPGPAQAGVFRVSPQKWREFYEVGDRVPVLTRLAGEAAGTATPAPAGKLRQEVLAAAPEQRQRLVEDYLAGVLGFAPGKLDVTRPLAEVGLDSLVSVELKNRVAADLGVTLTMSHFLQMPSTQQLAAALLAELPAAEAGGADKLDEVVRMLEQLSDEEARALLASEQGVS
jgi:acyl transferase domain-containing protein